MEAKLNNSKDLESQRHPPKSASDMTRICIHYKLAGVFAVQRGTSLDGATTWGVAGAESFRPCSELRRLSGDQKKVYSPAR